MLEITELAKQIDPSRSVLFLGAGAALTSGGPTGAQLAERLAKQLDPSGEIDGDLGEVASILELRRGRTALIEAVRNNLSSLEPTGGLLAIPSFAWAAIYGTNYDYLVERAYERLGRPLAVSRSNFDFATAERNPDATSYFKIHGCLSQDLVDGHKARIVLTEGDFDEYSGYREVLFKRLDLDLQSHDFIVIGSSLRDPHIRQYMDDAARMHRERHAPGRLFAVIYDRDVDRATLLERKGYEVAFGSLDEFADALAQSAQPDVERTTAAEKGPYLSGVLAAKTVDIAHAANLASNAARLFNGSPATHADVRQNLTFRREVEPSVIQAYTHRDVLVATIIGTGGVGKTTLARRVLSGMVSLGYNCWEHNSSFPFLRKEWLGVESRLRANGEWGVLFIDDCTPILSQLNQLLAELARIDDCRLLLLVTAGTTQWKPRTKSPLFFSRGEIFALSQLTSADLNELLNLVDRNAHLRELISHPFAVATRSERFSLLRRRCAADMYVCLKNVFASESLDGILLREFAELSEDNQEVYRLVAALEAVGAQVHRQLVLRLLGIESGTVQALLELLEGVVDEFDIQARNGLFGLSTRHRVIAQTIASYKFASQDDKYQLFSDVIDSLNPTIFLELRLAREICDRDFGIGSLASPERQIELYSRLVLVVPGERIPRHRLIAQYIAIGELDLAEKAVRDAVESVRMDPPISRYAVKILLKRATDMPGIMFEDRVALLMRAMEKAMAGLRRYPADPYAHTVRGDVALAIAELTEKTDELDLAIRGLEDGFVELREPNMESALRRLRDARRSFGALTL